MKYVPHCVDGDWYGVLMINTKKIKAIRFDSHEDAIDYCTAENLSIKAENTRLRAAKRAIHIQRNLSVSLSD